MLKNLGPDHVNTVEGRILWARYRADAGETQEAFDQSRQAMIVIRKAYPHLSMNLWTPLLSMAHILNLAGRFAEAESNAREGLAVLENTHIPETDARQAQTLYELNTALYGEKKYGEAATTLERSARIFEQSGPQWATRAAELRKLIGERGIRSHN
jgi:hypothetical protein